MSSTRRVLWREGALLTPQHFQQADRHHAAALQRTRRSIPTPHYWGLTELEIDADALSGGTLEVRRLAGVLPSGTAFAAPDVDLLPAARALGDAFDAQADSLTVHVALPVSRGGREIALDSDGEPGARAWLAQHEVVPDACGLADERSIETIAQRPALVMRPDGGSQPAESVDGHEALEVARIVRTADGRYELDAGHAPPVLHATASPLVMQVVRRYLEMLTSRSEELAGQQRQTGGFAETAGFWLLHTVNSTLPVLRHLYGGGRGAFHPEQAFLALSRLAAELCTFAENRHPRELPAYEHADLGGTFTALDAALRDLLDLVVPSRCLQLPLERAGDSMFTAAIRDESLLADAQLYFSVLADLPEERLLAEFPAKAKLSSRDRVQQLIMMALRGAALRHVGTPPSEIPVQPGRLYFQIEKSGEHWDAIRAGQALALHVPPSFPGLRVELLAVKD